MALSATRRDNSEHRSEQHKPMIYVCPRTDGQVYKIGYSSTGLKSRPQEHAGMGFEFLCAIQGTRSEEQAVHTHFENALHRNSQGKPTKELFDATPEVSEWVDYLCRSAFTATDSSQEHLTYPSPYRWPWSMRSRLVNDIQLGLPLDEFVPGVRKPRPLTERQHITLSSESDDWYTPTEYVDCARRTMGGIDLDPASCALANQFVGAESIFTLQENGLNQEWYGRVWLNPPYGDQAGHWIQKLVADFSKGRVTQAITCLNLNSASTLWMSPLMENFPLCIFRGRINFLGGPNAASLNDAKEAANKGTVFHYLGSNKEAFVREFRPLGHCLTQVSDV